MNSYCKPKCVLTKEQIEEALNNGISESTLRKRIYNNWSLEDAIQKPIQRKSLKDSWKNKVFALYKGDNFIADGTVFEIAEKTGKPVSAIKTLMYPSYIKKAIALQWVDYQVLEYLGEEGKENDD